MFVQADGMSAEHMRQMYPLNELFQGLTCGLGEVPQRILARTAAMWPNDKTGIPVLCAPTAYDHWRGASLNQDPRRAVIGPE
jgi:hypothetical protein